MSSYAAFQPFWEAWKRNTRLPSDPGEAANWDAAHEIFRAVPDPEADIANGEALAFVRGSLPDWHSRLKERPEWNPETGRLRLYRGMRNESAAKVRVHGRACIPAGKLTSMAFKRESAVGFAGQGFNDGYVCIADVPLDAIVFADLDGLYREGNMHDEAEIVVLAQIDIPVRCEIERVTARSRTPRSRTTKAANERERERLEQYEASLLNQADNSGVEAVDLPEREDD